MKRRSKTTRAGSLDAIYHRIDAVHMGTAERVSAKAALAQADTVAVSLLAFSHFVKRLLGGRALHPTSAHG